MKELWNLCTLLAAGWLAKAERSPVWMTITLKDHDGKKPLGFLVCFSFCIFIFFDFVSIMAVHCMKHIVCTYIWKKDIVSWSLWRVLPVAFRHVFKLDAIWIMFKCFLYKTWRKNYLWSNTFNLNTCYATLPTRYFVEGKSTVNLTVI